MEEKSNIKDNAKQQAFARLEASRKASNLKLDYDKERREAVDTKYGIVFS